MPQVHLRRDARANPLTFCVMPKSTRQPSRCCGECSSRRGRLFPTMRWLKRLKLSFRNSTPGKAE